MIDALDAAHSLNARSGIVAYTVGMFSGFRQDGSDSLWRLLERSRGKGEGKDTGAVDVKLERQAK